MTTPTWTKSEPPLLGLGMSSLVLGVIGLLLFFLPVLGMPISACGLLFGVIGLVGALFPTGTSLRWCLAGTATCALAVAVNLAILYAPADNVSNYTVPELWQPAPDPPSVPPPRRSDEG